LGGAVGKPRGEETWYPHARDQRGRHPQCSLTLSRSLSLSLAFALSLSLPLSLSPSLPLSLSLYLAPSLSLRLTAGDVRYEIWYTIAYN